MSAVFGPTNPRPAGEGTRRFGSVIRLRPGMEQRYRELHACAWDTVTARLRQSNVHNYTIFLTELDGRQYLFSYFEYSGSDFDADMRRIAEDAETRRWWRETDPCQIPLGDTTPGKTWQAMEQVFHLP